MTSFVEEVIAYLDAQGLGTEGTDLFALTLPDEPYICTAVIPTGGGEIGGDPTRQPTIQVLHRHTNVASGLEGARLLDLELDNKWNVLPNYSGRMLALVEPGSFYRDDNKHVVYSLNYVFYTSKAT